MDKDEFLQVLTHFSGTNEQEARQIMDLQKEYYYSQLLHVLAARVSKDHAIGTHAETLQMAAVFSADRGVLKHIMDAHEDEHHSPPLNTPDAIIESTTSPPSITDDLARELKEDMDRLNTLRHNFEMLFIDGGGASSTPYQPSQDTPTNFHSQTLVYAPVGNEEVILEEIVESKLEHTPENERQKEQMMLIEQFIQKQPNISPPKAQMPEEPTDLTFKSAEFGDNVVSETLVEILIKQGKNDKAIEVLKKLIWKFPQKKAYFAAQIEELKK